VETTDHYRTLGVERNASQQQIKQAYRRLVRKVHPDLSGEPLADQKTKALNAAYAVLGDPVRRAVYDALGRPAPGRAGSAGAASARAYASERDAAGGSDSSGGGDFFSNLFGAMGRRNRNHFRLRGDDIRASLALDLVDSYRGAQRVLSVQAPALDLFGRSVLRTRQVSVAIPKGVLAGEQLRVAGAGQSGVDGGAAGDLLLDIAFKPSAQYHIDGRDVLQSVPLAPWEAALGAQIELSTPSGRITVCVPPASQAGRKLRLKGRGIPASPPGDLYLLLDVVLPPANDARSRALYETMARELHFNPRRGSSYA
jgi:curved DNA-binding protein